MAKEKKMINVLATVYYTEERSHMWFVSKPLQQERSTFLSMTL